MPREFRKRKTSFSLWSPFLPVWKMSRAFEGKHRSVERSLRANIKDTPCQPLPPPHPPFLFSPCSSSGWPLTLSVERLRQVVGMECSVDVQHKVSVGRERERDGASQCTTSKSMYPQWLKWSKVHKRFWLMDNDSNKILTREFSSKND